MNIFSDDIESIRHELELIKDSFIKSSPKRIKDSFEILEGFYQILYEIGGEEDLEATEILLKNKKIRDLKARERNVLHKKNINNFIENKETHQEFANRIMDLYNRDFKHYLPKSLYLKENQMFEIICDFLNDEFNQADKFIELINNKQIFRIGIADDENSSFEAAGYTMYDYINNNSFVVISDDKTIRDVNLMRVICHEFGHVADNIDRGNSSRKDNVRYYWISGYPEVYSMLYEKLFYNYLIKNNIFKENASFGLKRFYIDVYDNLNTIEYLSTLDNDLLKNERYRKDEDYLQEHIQVDDDGMMYINSEAIGNLNEANIYSYGGILANYFSYLKQNDIDRFNREFSNFKLKRFGLFDFKIFEDIGTNIEDMVKIYSKGLDEITENPTKKLILK